MICHRCGASVPEELPICGSCGQDLTIPRDTPTEQHELGEDTNPRAEVSSSLRLRDVGMGDQASGLPYAAGDVVVDRYEIEDVIAEGPVGVVYSAVDLDMDVQIALKVVLAEYFPNPGALAKFQRAMAPARELSHANVVRVYDMAPDETRFVIAEQLVMGRTLSEVLAERLPQGIVSPTDEVRAILTQMGEALAYAHPETPHGALKPQNVLILPAELVITDFCLAGAIDRDAYVAGHRHARLPTRYLAPEFLAGRRYDHRADLYSLSVIAFELLTGIPYPNDETRAMDALAELPGPARKALTAGLSHSPNERPADVDDLVEGLLAATDEDTSVGAGAGRGTDPMGVGDSTNVLDISELELVEEDDSAEDYAEDGEGTDPGAYDGYDDDDSFYKRPSTDTWPDGREAKHSIPPAEDSTDPFDRLEPGELAAGADPEGLIETADEIDAIPDIDVDRRPPPPRPGLPALQPQGLVGARPRKVQEALEEMDFEASLEDALASAARVPPPPAARKKKPKRGPGYDPDPEAMRNRPVSAAGVAQASFSESKLSLPAYVEPAVEVMPQAEPRREGTAQVPIPERPRGRGIAWILIIVFAVLVAGGTAGIILWKRNQDKKKQEADARRRAHLIALAKQRQLGMGTAPVMGTMALPLPGTMSGMSTGPRPTAWKGRCPATAVHIKHRRKRLDFCIDRYEYPGTKGVMPITALDVDEAARLCRKQGKRLCTRKEWQWACGGKKKNLFGYGNEFQKGLCVTATATGGKRPVARTGSHAGCRSDYDVYDLNGNVAEWVASSQLLGGSAGKPANQTTCRSDAGAGGSAYYGVRCCADPRKK